MWETPAVRPHEKPLLIMEAGIVPSHGGEARYRTAPAESLTSPLARGNPEDLIKGKQLYFSFCAPCHGQFHDGKGTVGQSFFPLPNDLRSEKIQRSSDGILFKDISYGIPGGRQPPLATTIRVEDRWRIIAYLKSLGQRP
jgi:mono/diheme cytochrome c family protein